MSLQYDPSSARSHEVSSCAATFERGAFPDPRPGGVLPNAGSLGTLVAGQGSFPKGVRPRTVEIRIRLEPTQWVQADVSMHACTWTGIGRELPQAGVFSRVGATARRTNCLKQQPDDHNDQNDSTESHQKTIHVILRCLNKLTWIQYDQPSVVCHEVSSYPGADASLSLLVGTNR
jgi:hypothetical protein